MIQTDGFKIVGGKKLKGEIEVSGSKNSSLPILAATLLADGEYIVENVPNLKDIKTMLELLKELGLEVLQLSENSYKIVNLGKNFTKASYNLVKTMRASFLVMGPLLGKIKKAEVSLPGGCAIGARPVNYHLKGFESLGAEITIEHGYVKANVKKLKGNSIYLDFPSVGATENILMAAVKAEGRTVIENAAQEPEIDDLCDVLIKMGAIIKGIGTSRIQIEGVQELKGFKHKIIPDRIEAGTYLLASLLYNGNIRVKNLNLMHLESFKIKLEEMGAAFEGDYERGYIVKGKLNKLKPVKITTMPYPGFPTDLQPQILVVLSLLKGKTSEVKETIFENRFMHISELNRMGANIAVEGNIAVVTGVDSFSSARVMASDLRAGASLILAALLAKGETLINRVYHIDRGYEEIEKKLSKLGADIEREKVALG